jgi:hypothetical protein
MAGGKSQTRNIQFDPERLQDAVRGCWLGKNIGGTLGAPFEGQRTLQNVSFYVQKNLNGNPEPNDDLDLQLAWLALLEYYGVYHLTHRRLGEYWISAVIGPWNEYAVCRWNCQNGFYPPLSGSVDNDVWKWSNGAWIRSEIWACLFPGSPTRAARAAYADACCDHCGEGIYAEIFTAALQSAAFVESDIMKLIEIGLSLIPAESRIAALVRSAIKFHAEGRSLADARNAIVKETADLGWFQAPGNLAFAILGLLYGEGDFGKTLAFAVNCGDDADCTAGFAGAVIGIILGKSGIPKKWTDPVGDAIVTCSIENTGRICVRQVPKTLAELTDRVIACAEAAAVSDPKLAQFTNGETSVDKDHLISDFQMREFKKFLAEIRPYELAFDQPWGLISFEFENGPYIESGKPLRIKVRMKPYYSELMLVSVRLRLPEGWLADRNEVLLTSARTVDFAELTVTPGAIAGSVTGIEAEVKRDDRVLPSVVVLPLVHSGSVAYIR